MLTLYLLQNQAFWPDGLSEWIGAVVALVGLAGALNAFLLTKINRLRTEVEANSNKEKDRAVADVQLANKLANMDADRDRMKAELVAEIDRLSRKSDERFEKHGKRIGRASSFCSGNKSAIEGLRGEIAGMGHRITDAQNQSARVEAEHTEFSKKFDLAVDQGLKLRLNAEKRFYRLEVAANLPPLKDES